MKKKCEQVSSKKEIFSSEHLFGIQQDLNLSNNQIIVLAQDLRLATGSRAAAEKGFQENLVIHSHVLDDLFDEIQISYVCIDKDTKVREHFKQATVICNHLPRLVDLVLKKRSLEDCNSPLIKIGLDEGGGFLKFCMSIKLCGKILYPTEGIKYLGVKIDTNLTWQHHLSDLSIKLNRPHALLFKMRKYVSLKILRCIYFAIFDSYLSYCCLVWSQNFSTIQRILILQKKAVRIIDFEPRNFHTSPLFKQNSILKFQDKICLENIVFVSKSLNNLSPSIFNK